MNALTAILLLLAVIGAYGLMVLRRKEDIFWIEHLTPIGWVALGVTVSRHIVGTVGTAIVMLLAAWLAAEQVTCLNIGLGIVSIAGQVALAYKSYVSIAAIRGGR